MNQSNVQQQWQDLLARPLDFTSREHLIECFGGELTTEQLQSLQHSPRFQERLLRLVMLHFKLPALNTLPVPDERDMPGLLLASSAFEQLPRMCGAVWHAATLSREIRKEAVTELRRALGNDVYALALASRDLAGAADLLREPAQLIESIDHDGRLCVGAWWRSQSVPLQHWMCLRLPCPGTDETRLPRDIDIVRRMTATFAPSTQSLQDTERSPQAEADTL